MEENVVVANSERREWQDIIFTMLWCFADYYFENFVLLKGIYHAEFYCKKAKSFIAMVLVAAMCSTFISANAFAENVADNPVSITMNMDYSREVV